MLSSGFSVALAVPSITVIFGFMGSTLCAFICFILPASFYLKSISGSSTRSTREAVIRSSNRGFEASFKAFMAVLLLFYGLFVMVVGTAINVRDFKIANAN
jgi:amino acid permease